MRRNLLWAIFVCYAGLLVRVVLLKHHFFVLRGTTYAERLAENMARANVIPLHTIAIYANGLPNWSVALPNLLGNVLIFMPLGILLPLLKQSTASFWRIAFIGFSLSLALECVQMAFMMGTFDVDDLILNTLGTALGYVCLKIARRLRS